MELGLYFANADYVRSRVLAEDGEQTRCLILDGESSPFVDVSGASMLVQLREDLQRRGITLPFARQVSQVRDVVGKAESELRGHGVVFASVDEAVAAAQQAPDGLSPSG